MHTAPTSQHVSRKAILLLLLLLIIIIVIIILIINHHYHYYYYYYCYYYSPVQQLGDRVSDREEDCYNDPSGFGHLRSQL